MVEVASIIFSYNIQPFERQAHRRFSSRSRYGGMQLRIRMSLRVLLHALLQNHFSTLLLSHFLTLHCVGTNRLSISATGWQSAFFTLHPLQIQCSTIEVDDVYVSSFPIFLGFIRAFLLLVGKGDSQHAEIPCV
jgi:hypothetical protein